jgi:hypothetical protein
VSVPCPVCGTAVYVSLPAGHRFVTADPGEGDDGRSDLSASPAECGACESSFTVVHGPPRA